MLKRARQRGLSIIELMVGVTVGMLVVGGALSLFARNVSGSRQLLLEARLNQDLRAAMDLVTRDLRRAGYWGNAIQGTLAVGASASAPQNPYAAVDTSTSNQVTYQFSQSVEDDVLTDPERFGFRLNGGALEMESSNGSWTSITDSSTITINSFSITPTVTTLPLGYLCPKTCNAGTPNCPTVTVRSIALLVQGTSVKDSSIVRTLRSTVRLRNDSLAGTCPA